MARILIVDDAPIMRKSLKTILVHAGHTIVAEAGNGAQAYMEYVNHKPDLVTMDITMPYMNGLETVKKIMKEFPNAKIIIISNSNNNKVIFESLQCGAKNYIMKPFVVDSVLEVVSQVLQLDTEVNSETIDNIYKNMAEDYSGAHDEESSKDTSSKASPEAIIPIAYDLDTKMFSIELVNDTFIVNVNKSIDRSGFHTLHTAMQGFLFVKPLNIVFNFQDIEDIESDIADWMVYFMNNAVKVGGKIRFISPHKEFVALFKLKNISPEVSFYSYTADVN